MSFHIVQAANLVAQECIQRVANISELFDALAVGWVENPEYRNRFIAAGRGVQFVRVPEGGYVFPFHKIRGNDIPIESGAYSMRGFVKFETNYLFPGFFKTNCNEEDDTFSAELTKAGYEFSKLGIVDFDFTQKCFRHSSFFNPPSLEIIKDAQLADRGIEITGLEERE